MSEDDYNLDPEFNYYYCPECDHPWEEERAKDEGEFDYDCPECGTCFTPFHSEEGRDEAVLEARRMNSVDYIKESGSA